MTPPMELPLGSPGMDAADAATALLTDQRGVARPLNDGFDIGAFEAREPAADLAIAKSVSVATATPGDAIVYNLAVVNQGPDGAQGVRVVDSLPAGLSFSSCTTSAGSCGGSGNDREVSIGDLAATGAAQIALEALLGFNVADGAVVSNTAAVNATAPDDPNVANNSASASFTVRNRADLQLTQKVAKLTSRRLRYTITVRNLGPYEARVIELEDPMPNGTQFLNVDAGSWSCVALPAGSVGTLTCDKASLGPNEVATVVLEVKTTAPGTVNIVNTATVRPATFDPKPANNVATLTTRVSGK
jgi:uncharacterized repeat protein (TIGR01451 family)